MEQELRRNIALLNQHLGTLQKEYHVKRLGIFGSRRKGDYRAESDLDIVVEFSAPIGLFKFVELERVLSSIVGIKVDLVSKNGLKPIIRDAILKEAVYA